MEQPRLFAPKRPQKPRSPLQRVFEMVGFSERGEAEIPLRPLSSTLSLVSLGQRVSLAFQNIPPTETEVRVIQALIELPGANVMTLSETCGWKLPIWQTHFGLMCQKRVDWLLPSELLDQGDTEFMHGVLLDYNPADASFKMKAEVVEAFNGMGLGAPSKLDWPARACH